MDMIDEPVLIEEQVDTGLKPLLDSYRPAYPLESETPNTLNRRFSFSPERPLPMLSHAYAKAYEAQDSTNPQRRLYAMVLENRLPYRQQAMADMHGLNNPSGTMLVGYGTVSCSHLGESRMVLFLDQPGGTRLSETIQNQTRIHEHRVIDFVLQPALRALLVMRDKKLSHGNIRPEAFFIGEQTTLGECFSAPPGTLTHYLYEPPERINATPLGRGDADEKGDVYALGVLAYELLYGLDKLKDLGQDEFNRRSLNTGIYHVFSNNREFSDLFSDFFRGVLTDNPNERWGIDQLAQWLGGKRFNMIAPQAPKEAGRSILFMEEEYYSRRLLAYMFQKYWRDTAKELRSLRLDRWVEMSLHRPDMAERLDRAMRIAGNASTERQVNDMMTRVIAILDPLAPIRCLHIGARPDGFGPLLADLLQNDSPTELNELLNFIETDIANFWSDLDGFNKLGDSQTFWRLQRVRPFLKSRAFGFGVERLLYELNPSLPCQSELLRAHHITTPADALKALDALAKQAAPDTSFVDRHLAAFLAAKIDMSKEIRLIDLSTMPVLANNPELVVLKIIARTQQKYERLNLVGLSAWAAMRVEKMLDEIHNRVVRKELKLQLKKLASSGSMNDVLSAVVNREIALQDHEGFAKAIALHQINHMKIERFQNPKLIERHANDLGGRLASLIASAVLIITGFCVLSDVLGV